MVVVLKLYDSMRGVKLDFIPASPSVVKVYGCGPTVYNRPHVGNIRTMVAYDLLVRTLEGIYPEVIFVRNITDVDDKLINSAIQEGRPVADIAKSYTGVFHDEMARMFCKTPTREPRVTEYIGCIVEFIQRLMDGGHAYTAPSGVYFDVSTFPEYGALSRRKTQEQNPGARVGVDEHKRNPEDFALWKLEEAGELVWPSPWGAGRPGWHIECSAMCYKELGADFDIHCGGEDLKFPHHENEIAQSLCASPGSSFARYWMHVAFVVFGDKKMSKSLGNVVFLDDLLSAEVNPEVVRYNLLSAHYRKPIAVSPESLAQSRRVLDKVYDVLLRFGLGDSPETQRCVAGDPFWEAICDDLNTPLAITVLNSIVSEINSTDDEKLRMVLLGKMVANAKFLGLLNYSPKQWFSMDEDDDYITGLVNERELARQRKDFAESDRIKAKLQDMGVEVRDTKTGPLWIRKKLDF